MLWPDYTEPRLESKTLVFGMRSQSEEPVLVVARHRQHVATISRDGDSVEN